MKQFAVIGLGRFGSSVAGTLYDQGYEVLGIDIDPACVQAMSNRLTHVVVADATDEEVLRSLGIRNLDVVVVAIGTDIQASILVTLLLKEMGVQRVVAKATSELHGKVLAKTGADEVVFPELDMGVRLAHRLIASNVIDHLELGPDYSLVEIRATEQMTGKTLRQLGLRAKYGVSVIVIRRGDEIKVNPHADDRVEAGDVLVVIGQNDDLSRLQRAEGD